MIAPNKIHLFTEAITDLTGHAADSTGTCPCCHTASSFRMTRYDDGYEVFCYSGCTEAEIKDGVRQLLSNGNGNGNGHHPEAKSLDVNVVRSSPKSESEITLEPEALQGLPGAVVRAIDPHTESHPAAVLASFLIGAGCLIGNGPFVYRDGARHGVNEFACIVGLSARGRKGTASRRTDEIFRGLCDPNATSQYDILTPHDMSHRKLAWDEMQISGLGSGEALVDAIASAAQSGEACPRRMVFEAEFSKPLKVMAREGSVLSETLRDAWDGAALANRTKGRTLYVKTSHLSILSHVTEHELKSRLHATELFNGFSNRFLWFLTFRSKSLPFGGGEAPLAPLVAALKAALGFCSSVKRMEFDAETKRLWDKGGVYDRLIDRPPGLLGSVTSRAESHVTRLALLYALLDQNPEIRVEHLMAALAVWDYNERTCAYIFGCSLGDDYADLILEWLLDVCPGGLTRTEIRDRFNRNSTAGRIPKALELLRDQHRATCSRSSGVGRPVEYWTAVVAGGTVDGARPNDITDQSPLRLARRLLAGRSE